MTKNTKKLVATSTTILFLVCTQKEHCNKLKTKIFTTLINNINCVTNVIIESKWNWILSVLMEEGKLNHKVKHETMRLCLPLMKNIVPKVDAIGKCCDRMFINWVMWRANERKTMIMCICLPWTHETHWKKWLTREKLWNAKWRETHHNAKNKSENVQKC